MYCRSVWEKSGEYCQAPETAAAGQDVVAEGAEGALSGCVLIFDTNGDTHEDTNENTQEDTNKDTHEQVSHEQVSQTLQERMTARGESGATAHCGQARTRIP